MPDLVEKKEKFEVIRHKLDSLAMVLKDMDDEDLDELSIKEMHDMDKHVFEILKIIERY
jgi:hypothetical protein